MSKIKTFDIETTTFSRNKRKATPFGAGNWTVMSGFRSYSGEQHIHYFGATKPADGWLLPVLEGTRMLVGFNIKFDILHAVTEYPRNLAAWMDYVAGGGMIWCCQLAEYLLNGMFQSEHMLSLDETAPRYGGELKHDEVKALWEAGVQTHDIDRDLLERYLGGGPDKDGQYKPGDLQNTETVALAQIRRAKEAGQYNSIILNMGSLLASIEMERNGMFCDRTMGEAIAAELEKDLARLELELQAYLPVLPFKFSWNSPKQKSALIFGGKVKYESTEYLGTVVSHAEGGAVTEDVWWCPERDGDKPDGWEQAYSMKEELHILLSDGSTVAEDKADEFLASPCPLSPVRNKSGKNAGEVKTKKVRVPDHDKPKSRKCDVYFYFPRLTEPSPRWAGAEEGVWSTSSDVIEELGSRDLPFLKAMALVQRVTKDLGTYYIRTDEDGKQTGMLTLVGEDGIIHHSLNHTSTVTGRFSSSNPNLQNLSRGDKSQVKNIFRSRFGEDGVIVQDDFSSLEVYVQANLTLCKALIEDLRAGIDMHCMRVAAKEKRAYDEVLLLCKGDDSKGIPAVKEWKYKRTAAKEFSFQRAYGAGAAKIAETTGMAVEDVEALIAAEELRYPEIVAFFEDEVKKAIGETRRPTSQFVPHPTAKRMVQLARGFYRAPSGKLYGFMESPTPDFLAKRGQLSGFSPTEIKNYPVQGEGGEWMKAAMWLAVREFYRHHNWQGQAMLINTVHDALYADSRKAVAGPVAVTMHACMQAASDLIEWMFDWEIAVPVPAEIGWGPSMGEEEHVKMDGFEGLVTAARTDIRNRYMAGYTPSYLQ
jgi:DNA polymerase I